MVNAINESTTVQLRYVMRNGFASQSGGEAVGK
jgi:hypothetical protein